MKLNCLYRDKYLPGEILEVLDVTADTVIVYVHANILSCRLLDRAKMDAKLSAGELTEIVR